MTPEQEKMQKFAQLCDVYYASRFAAHMAEKGAPIETEQQFKLAAETAMELRKHAAAAPAESTTSKQASLEEQALAQLKKASQQGSLINNQLEHDVAQQILAL